MIDVRQIRHSPLRSVIAAIVAVLLIAANAVIPAAAFTNNYNRSVTMLTAQPSATSVNYHVALTADSSYSLRTIIIDFCSNSPLAGQTCTAPTGFSVGTPTAANLLVNGSTPGGTWTPSALNSGRTFEYSGSAGTAVSAGNTISFDITSVTNPSTIGSFYGRIFTYTTAAPAYNTTDTDVFAETGSVALSTASGIGFVFQVPESLQFCVYKSSCGDTPAVVLGHGANSVLDSSQIDTDTALFSISTNALGGAVVNAYGSTPKIPSARLNSIGGGTGTMTTMVAGTEAFGFRLSPTSGTIAAGTCYAGAGNNYCFNDTMLPPSGSPVPITQQATPGPINSQVMTITFAATASTTTRAGLYTSNIVLIAVATF